MLNALSVSLRGGDPEGRLRASQSFERQGFVLAGSFDWENGALDAWMHPSQSAIENASVRTTAGFACCVGPLWYRGRFGRAGLALLIDEIGAGTRLDETLLHGNFALFVCSGEDCILMNDALGLVRVYAGADGAFFSTSWLAACAYAGRVELDEAAAIEYVLLGASHSDATAARGITTLPLAHAFDLARRCTTARFPASAWAGDPVPASFDAAAERANALLRARFKDFASAFPGRVRAALSGGFDSRLILAGLLASGVRPELFVYGAPDFEDVPVARSVASELGIPLTTVDKQQLSRQLALPDIERLVQNALFFDGLPSDGIYDAGVDQQTRLDQTAGGCLALNGGGGEIFRNYFHLPNRAFEAMDIVRTFYRGFDAGVFRRPDGLRGYRDRLATSMERVLGMDSAGAGRKLDRWQVELLYPLFRCHHWMGVNNSVGVRHGYYTTPLVDLDAVRLACRLSLSWKNAGRLESRLIAGLHRGAAEQSSVYGFRFAEGPDRHARFKEWLVCMRPVFARPFINAMHRRLRRHRVAPDLISRCRELLPGKWRLDPVLDLARLPDSQAFSRALAVEIAWRELVG